MIKHAFLFFLSLQKFIMNLYRRQNLENKLKHCKITIPCPEVNKLFNAHCIILSLYIIISLSLYTKMNSCHFTFFFSSHTKYDVQLLVCFWDTTMSIYGPWSDKKWYPSWSFKTLSNLKSKTSLLCLILW